MTDAGTVILGAGMAGFGAAYCLSGAGVRARLYDDRSTAGGHTSSFAFEDGFIFDDGPHISFTSDERFQELLAESVGGLFERIRAYVNNYWKGHWIKHPAPVNLHGLPTEVVVACIRDFVKAQQAPKASPANYEEWLLATYGEAFSRYFPCDYTIKYHTIDATRLTTDWLGPRLYQPDLEEVLRGALEPETPDVHYVDRFRYPTHGGFVQYLNRFLPLADQFYDHRLVSIDPRSRVLEFANGQSCEYGQLISSIPLNTLIPMIKGAPADVVAHARKLAVTRALIVNIGVDRHDLSPAQWTYFYDRDVCFSRLSFPHLLSPNTVPAGCGGIQAEIYFSDKYLPFTGAPDAWIDPTIQDLIKCGLLRESDNVLHRSAWLTSGNVIFDMDRPAAIESVHGYLDDIGIAYCGRYGDWGYMWTDESFFSGENAARKVLNRL